MLLRSLVVPALLAVTLPAVAAERTAVLEVENMYCATCPYIVREALLRVEGVANVAVSLDERTATVVYDDATADLDTLSAAATGAGYPARARR